MKILASGCSVTILKYCSEYNMLKYIVPVVDAQQSDKLYDSLSKLDDEIGKGKAVRREYMIYSLTRVYLHPPTSLMIQSKTAFREIFKAMKAVIAPLTPPNIEVEKAVVLYFKELGITARIPNAHGPKQRRGNNYRRRKPARKKMPPGTPAAK